MEVKTMYRYVRPNGGITVSTVEPNVPYDITYRVIAAAGMLVTKDGSVPSPSVDTDDPDGWTEVPDLNEEFSDAAESDYLAELKRLGVRV